MGEIWFDSNSHHIKEISWDGFYTNDKISMFDKFIREVINDIDTTASTCHETTNIINIVYMI